jgi:hypothetical protein
MKRKTTITLTIAALLSLSGMVYAANHVLFSFIVGTFSAGPIGVAASSTDLFATQFCDPELLSINCVGIPTPLTTIPGFPSGQCLERYMAVAPLQSANAGFAPRDIFITQGNQIFQFRPPLGPLMPFTTLPACGDDHTGITFDHVGTFGNKMILSCENGTIWSLNGAPTPPVAPIATLPINIENEGPAVAPSPGFGTYGGQILVTNDNDAVNAIRSDGFVTLNAFVIGAGTGPEDVQVIPETPCPYCSGGYFFQTVETSAGFGTFQGLYEYPTLTDFSSFPGDILVPCEGNSQIVRIHWNSTTLSYDMFFFDILPGGLLEGSSFVDCDVPSPTPTPTATFTPTPTATFTPTPTATFTPTPTATFTPTPTATFTPTPTPTPTSSAGCQIPTSITSNFNGTAINAGRTIWFTSVLKVKNLPANQVVTIHFTNQSIMSSAFNLSPGDATVIFDPNATTATTTFAGGNPTTTVPAKIGGNTFFSALSYLVPANIPGGLNPVTWSGTISSDTPGVEICWQWAAAVYTNFDNVNYNALGVKPVDDNKASIYKNSDHAGTPENFKQFVIGGARGGGGSNYTGSLSGTVCVKCPTGTPTPSATPTATPTPTVVAGSCAPSSSMSVLVTGTNVIVYVPKGCWSCGGTGVSVVNLEGSSITDTLIPTADVINSCASNAINGQTVCTANNNKVYILKGTALDPAVVPNPLTSSGSGTISFSGGTCTNCGVAMDATHNKALIGLAVASVASFQFLNLGSSPSFEPAFATMNPGGQIAEDPLIDPIRNLVSSPSEDNNYEILNVTTSTSPAFFERSIPNSFSEADSAGEDCSTGITLAPYEFTSPSQVFVADLNSAVFTPGSPGSWTSLSAVNTLTESFLSAGASGCAVAQGTHTGIITGEFGGDEITAIAMPPAPGVVVLPDWLSCNIGSGFINGKDPHTVTAYMSPNNGHAYAVLANQGATTLAVVDLTMMLTVPRTVGGHACASRPLPASVVRFVTVP